MLSSPGDTQRPCSCALRDAWTSTPEPLTALTIAPLNGSKFSSLIQSPTASSLRGEDGRRCDRAGEFSVAVKKTGLPLALCSKFVSAQ